MEPLERKNFLSTPEAAEMMMCSALHIRNLIKDRKLPVYKVGTRSYIPKAAVEEYIKSQTHDIGGKNHG